MLQHYLEKPMMMTSN